MTITSAILMAVSVGISAYSSYQQGKTADAVAQYNAHQQEFNARAQLLSLQAQSAYQKRMAEANFRLRQTQAQAQFDNARIIEEQAASMSANARESARRKEEEYSRFIGTQRANIAASGIVESSGTPLDILAETAGKIQLEREDALYADETNRRTLFREADLERLGGRLALAGATLDRSSEVAAAGLRGATGQLEYRSAMNAAEITRLSGAAERQAGNLGAAATLIGGAAKIGGMYASPQRPIR